MSRIGKKAIEVPAGVKVAVKDHTVSVEGPKGKLSFSHSPDVKVAWAESEKSITCSIDESKADDRVVRAMWGTTRAIVRNMIEGVTKGYERSLEVVGVGWATAIVGKQLKLNVGLANTLFVDIPTGLTVTVEKAIIRVNGADRQQVGHFAASVRGLRKPEPYNGKGIKYTDETIRRKQGKKVSA